jgi:hypothetical protein
MQEQPQAATAVLSSVQNVVSKADLYLIRAAQATT